MENQDNHPPTQPPIDDNQPVEIDESGRIDPEGAEPAKAKEPGNSGGRLVRFKNWYAGNKKFSIPATVLVLIIVLFAVPFTRYALAGTVVKKDVKVLIKDSKTQAPVSGALVKVGSMTFTTGASGEATLTRLSVGHHTISVSKTYYQTSQTSIMVPLLKPKSESTVAFTATGRQVSITVTNLITGQPVADAQVKIDSSTSVTDAKGTAQAVVPAGVSLKDATVSAKGFNDAAVQLAVSDSEVKDNAVKLTPAGKVYFLSKLSGNIDVVKTNLDGTDRKTVLAGTGKEDDRNTVLLASRDWQYLALLSSRDGTQKLYVINTDDDSLINVDNGDATFAPVGWHDHYFVYTVARNGYQDWQPNAFSIKSYNADNGKIQTLANTGASGSSNADAQYEAFWSVQLAGSDIYFTRTWYQYPGYTNVAGRQDSLATIQPDGTGSRTVKSVDASTGYISDLRLNKPNQLEFSIYNQAGNNSTYYTVDQNGNVSQSGSANDFNQPAITYLQAPTAEQTFWQEPRDGKNSLFVGDENGANPKQVASLSDFNAYGWYTDNYLLLSKDSSELYIIPASGITDDNQAIKITDYHKPAQDFYGYGGGYGGL